MVERKKTVLQWQAGNESWNNLRKASLVVACKGIPRFIVNTRKVIPCFLLQQLVAIFAVSSSQLRI